MVLSNKLILNYTKTYAVIFKSPNKKIINPDDYLLELGNRELKTIPCTIFLGITLDNNLIFKSHIVEICRKLNFILFLMRRVRPYLDITSMIAIYYTFFYPHLIYGVEIYGNAANCHLN